MALLLEIFLQTDSQVESAIKGEKKSAKICGKICGNLREIPFNLKISSKMLYGPYISYVKSRFPKAFDNFKNIL